MFVGGGGGVACCMLGLPRVDLVFLVFTTRLVKVRRAGPQCIGQIENKNEKQIF